MKTLKPYLIFSGDCEEALLLYSSCLDGEIITLQRYSESPLDLAEEHGNRVFNSVFRAEGVELMASDDLPDEPVKKGTNFAMFVTFPSEEEQAGSFAKLSEGGRILMPLQNGFGMLEDRFQVRWMLAVHG